MNKFMRAYHSTPVQIDDANPWTRGLTPLEYHRVVGYQVGPGPEVFGSLEEALRYRPGAIVVQIELWVPAQLCELDADAVDKRLFEESRRLHDEA